MDPLIGTVTDPDGKPVAGARVEARRAGGRGTGLLDLRYMEEWRQVGTAQTSESGRFALQLPAGLPCRVVVDQAPFAVFSRDECLPALDMPIRLLHPATVNGKVALADGRPVRATLRAWHRDTLDEVLQGHTDDQGAYSFSRVPPGPIRIEVVPEEGRMPDWRDVDLESGQTFTHDVSLDSGTILRGRVTDATTGEPIAGARIGEGWMLRRAATSDATGRYELRGYHSGARRLICVADGFAKAEPLPPEPLPETLEVDFRLRRGLRIAGRIVDADGKPIADAYVQVFGFIAIDAGGSHDAIGLRTDADGRFATSGLREGIDHLLVVRKDGYAMVVYALPEPDVKGSKGIEELVLPRPRIVRGIVTDPDGKPMTDTPVSIHGYNEDRCRFAPDGKLTRAIAKGASGQWGYLDRFVGRRRGCTDHLGRFAFGDIPPGDFHVGVHGARNAEIGASETFRVSASEEPGFVHIVADPSKGAPVPQTGPQTR
jgi:protocatechuate 3,4-dioxygenase beta subunit